MTSAFKTLLNYSILALAVFGVSFPSVTCGDFAYFEGWDEGNTNGWGGNTIFSNVERDEFVGNPAASLFLQRDLDNLFTDFGTTTQLPDVTGNFSAVDELSFSFDALYGVGDFRETLLRFRFQDSSFNGWYLAVDETFESGWQEYSVTLDTNWTDAEAMANGWVNETQGVVSWQQLMTDVFTTEIRIGAFMGEAEVHIDNVRLRSVPEPNSIVIAFVSLVFLVRRNRPDFSAV